MGVEEIIVNKENISLNMYCKDEGEKEKKAGVYVWGYCKGTKFIPLYVGKSENVYLRMLQHYCRFRSGEYRIPNLEILNDIYTNGKYTNNKVNRKNFIVYEPFGIGYVVNELSKHEAIIQLIIDKFVFRYCEIAKEENRALAEGSLASKIGRDRLISSRYKTVSKDFMTEFDDLLELLIHQTVRGD